MTFPDAATLLAPLGPWFQAARRPMPWRMDDLDRPHADPYVVLVSELMLQQTQVATVIPYFQRWLARFPDLETLAGAGEDDLHRFWAGLGYYRRARLLQAAARAVLAGGWPRDLAGLQALPGLGPYTAAALGAQAFQWPTAALDGNAFRVLARLLALEGDPRPAAPALRTWLTPALVRIGPSRLTQAIMELGATVCAPAPRCPDCPLQGQCRARLEGSAHRLPPAVPRTPPRAIDLLLVAIASPEGWLLRPPAGQGLLAGLWGWPWLEPGPAAGAAEDSADPEVPSRSWPGWVQVYTHRRETIHPAGFRLKAPRPAPAGLVWVPAATLRGLPMGKRDQRLREHALAADAFAGGPGSGAPVPWQALAEALWGSPAS